MEMQQIRYFIALSEELNFTRAARRCKVSQPSLTTAIQTLEHEFGAPLFQRKPRVALTRLGQAIWPALQEIVIQAEIARATAKATSGVEDSRIYGERRMLPQAMAAGVAHAEI
jgi:DNA-binding transcriptional LysR family regulator